MLSIGGGNCNLNYSSFDTCSQNPVRPLSCPVHPLSAPCPALGPPSVRPSRAVLPSGRPAGGGIPGWITACRGLWLRAAHNGSAAGVDSRLVFHLTADWRGRGRPAALPSPAALPGDRPPARRLPNTALLKWSRVHFTPDRNTHIHITHTHTHIEGAPRAAR